MDKTLETIISNQAYILKELAEIKAKLHDVQTDCKTIEHISTLVGEIEARTRV